MGMFDGIEAVSSSRGGVYLLPGQHRFRINALKSPPKLRAGQCFIAELSVVVSTNPAYEKGSTVSWICNITKSKYPELTLADIKGFLAAAAACEESSITNEAAQAAVADNQPFEGVLVDCEAYDKPNKENSGSFTKTIWSPVTT